MMPSFVPKKSFGLRTVFVLLSLLSLSFAAVFIYAISDFVRGLYPAGTTVPLDEAIQFAVYYTLFGMWLLFGILFLALHFKVLDPIAKLASSLRTITNRRDWNQRVPSVARIRELNSLVDDFNRMVGAVENDRARLHELSIKDALTGLLNRRGFEMRLHDEFERSKRFDSSFSIVLVDLDRFKSINDTYGHPAGDYVLREIAARLQHVLRRIDAFARIGGDEFVVILPETEPAAAMLVATKLHNAFNAAPFPIDDAGSVLIPATASIGVACYPRDGIDSTSLHQAVDEVLYKAKRSGKNCVVSLGDDGGQASFDRPSNLRRALADGLVDAVFQPIVSIHDGGIIAYEALARIFDGNTIHQADSFIEAAEAAGLAKDIDRCVFWKGIEVLKRSEVPLSAKMFFNFSTASFSDGDWMRSLPVLLKEANVACSRVVIEITEREALPNIECVKAIIGELRLHGIQFALDDFGSGFSSFAYIQNLHIDYLKIDGGFVRYMTSNPDDRTIVENIQRLAKSFGLKTVAEFVEDPATAAVLSEIGVDSAQGFHYGRPDITLRPLAALRAA